MKCAAIFWLGLVSFAGLAHVSAQDLAPGTIYVHTARNGTTLTNGDKATPANALIPGKTFVANGQVLNAPTGLAAALVLSNGNALYLPNGGRLIFTEFTQEPVADTSQNLQDEPSRSNLHLELTQGLLVIAGRNPVPTSIFTLTTPLAEIRCHAQSLVVQADADSVTITVLAGTAEVTSPGTTVHDTVQPGQTATITRHDLHDAYPLKMNTTSTDASEHFAIYIAAAHRIESNVTFSGSHQHFQVSMHIPVDFVSQISADDPRFL